MLKPSEIGRLLLGVLIVLAAGAALFWRVTSTRPAHEATSPSGAARPSACKLSRWQTAAAANRNSLASLSWSPFGSQETGWATYAPLIGNEVGARCPPDSSGFAANYARWQQAQRFRVDGVFKPEEFKVLRDELALRRPFVQLTARGACPSPPPAAMLASARPDEGYAGKIVRLRSGALAAYRRMVADARRAGVAPRAPLLTLVSGFRAPAEEAARCTEVRCDRVARARCSAHRTGLALDLYLEAAPGFDPTSSAAQNRRHMAQTPAYRWLVAHAGAYGFLPYAYEPWHWEWTGEAP
jgi:LAS superfamily LD-carboxypeptidase LdcB